MPDRPKETSTNHAKRLAWLLACILAGSAIAIVGESFSGSSVWYAAIPAVVAIGWMFLADPTACESSTDRQNKGASGKATP